MSDTQKEPANAFWSEGMQFSCTSCGHCCRHEPGYVFLSQNDLDSLATHMGISEKSFLKKYCRSVDLGITTRLSIRETTENDCIFWDQGCKVYEARPLQCRTYPFWPSIMASKEDWEEEANECPGMNKGQKHSKDEIEAALRQREREVLLSPLR